MTIKELEKICREACLEGKGDLEIYIYNDISTDPQDCITTQIKEFDIKRTEVLGHCYMTCIEM